MNTNNTSIASSLFSDSKKRVKFYTRTFRKRIKTILYGICALCILSISIAAYSYDLNFRELVTTIFFTVIIFTTFVLIVKNIYFTSIKGDMIIFQDLWKNSKVTTIESVQRVKTRSLLLSQMSLVSFVLDGKSRKCLILSNCDKNDPYLEEIIQTYHVQRKNKKANHKPGSVITQPA